VFMCPKELTSNNACTDPCPSITFLGVVKTCGWVGAACFLALFPWLVFSASDTECPDYSSDDGVTISDEQFAEYVIDPDVIRFPLNDSFICYQLKLYSRMRGPNGECQMGGSSSMPRDALGPGISYVSSQVTNHKNRCEYVEQVGLRPRGADW
jgi:hypothetical protein